MTFSNNAAESIGKFIFQNAVTASTVLADLNATAGSVTSLSIALHTADPGIGGAQTASEASFTGYSRQTVSRTSGNWPFTSPNIFENGVTITFGPNTGTSQTVSWASVGTGVSNRVIFRTPLALETPRPFVLDDTSGDVIRVPGHAYADDQEVIFVDVEGGTLPTGITEGTTYYVRASGKTADTFTISTSAGGGAHAISAQGSGYIARVSQKAIGTNDTLVFDTTNKLTFILR
jgi:hypothetical protein